MSNAQKFLTCWLLVAVIVLCGGLTVTVDKLPGMIDAAIAREGEATRQAARTAIAEAEDAVKGEITETRRQAIAEIRETRALALGEAQAWRRDALIRVDRGLRLADARSASIEMRLDAQASALTRPAAELLGVYRELPAELGARLDPWTDCEGNGACWQAQATALLGASRATAGEVARTARVIQETAPAIAGNLTRATGDVAAVTGRVSGRAPAARRTGRWGSVLNAAAGVARILLLVLR